MEPATHKLTLTQGSANLLCGILSAPPAIKGVKNRFAAGVLLTTQLDSAPQFPKELHNLSVRATEVVEWNRAPWQTIEITEAQRDACKEAAIWADANGAAPNGAEFNSLLQQLGLVE